MTLDEWADAQPHDPHEYLHEKTFHRVMCLKRLSRTAGVSWSTLMRASHTGGHVPATVAREVLYATDGEVCLPARPCPDCTNVTPLAHVRCAACRGKANP